MLWCHKKKREHTETRGGNGHVFSANAVATYLQSREEGLQRVNPSVHQLPAEHVHVHVQRRVSFSFVTGFPAGGPSRAGNGEKAR